MLIRDVIKMQGEVLFRYRGYVPLFLAPLVLIALHESGWMEVRYGDLAAGIYEGMCLLISMIGVALRVVTVASLPRRTSGRNTDKGQVADALNTTGMYSIVRHPLYLANSLVLLGALLVTGSLWLTLVGLLGCCLHYERLMHGEEDFLLKQYGDQFVAWANRTPAFFPRLSLWRSPAMSFCWRTALKREYLTAFGLIAVFTVLDYAKELLGKGRFEYEIWTAPLFLCALCLFLIVRYLRKQTRVLHVDGR